MTQANFSNQPNVSGINEFPDSFKEHPDFPKLAALVQSITSHPAMRIEQPHVLSNMMRASLAFTVCFYGNLLSCLKSVVEIQVGRHAFGVQSDCKLLHLFLEMAGGELATKNLATRADTYSPHCVAMLEAAQDAGVDTRPIEAFVAHLKTSGGEVKNVSSLLEPTLSAYLEFSEQCMKSFDDCFATIALRELTLSDNFRVLVDHLPDDAKLHGYRTFLETHIEVDSGEHSMLMAEALTQTRSVDRAIATMITFYELRKRVYDACLKPTPIF